MAESGWRDRHYGKITGGQLEDTLAKFLEMWEDRTRFFSGDTDTLEAWLQKLAAVPNWVGWYLRPAQDVIGAIAAITNTTEALQRAAQSDDKIQAVSRLVDDIPDDPPDHPLAMPLAWVLWTNLDAVARYSCTVNDMLAAAARGDGEAFFYALSIDSHLVSLPGCLATLRLGQLSGDHSFSEQVFKWIKGPHKKRLVYPQLRWIEHLLWDCGAFDECTQDEIHQLIVGHLKLYGDDDEHGNSKANLFKNFRDWRKERERFVPPAT